MEALRVILPLAILASLIGMEVALGLKCGQGELVSVLRRPMLLLRALLAVYVIVPIAALVMVSLFPLEPAVRGGILVMSVSSVPPVAPEKGLRAGGGANYTYGLYAALVLLSVVIVPTSVALESRLYGISIPLTPLPVATEVLEKVIAPIAAGLVIRRVAPRFAERAAPILGRLATILLAIAVAPILVLEFPAIFRLIGNGTVLAMALVAAIALAGGQLLGGPGPRHGASLATMAATRHPGIALMIVGAAGVEHPGQRPIAAAIIAFLLVSGLVAIPYQMWVRRRREPRAPTGAVPA
jgi:BASS family bile acid:Na+ symporter